MPDQPTTRNPGATPELPGLGARIRRRIWRRRLGLVARAAHNVGVDLVRGDYYGPNPDFENLPADVWDRRIDLPAKGIAFDTARQMDYVESTLGAAIAEFQPALGPEVDSDGFYLHNLFYESVDAELLYGFVRTLKPRRIVEMGSGFSTMVAARACRANAADGSVTEFLSHDPFPRSELDRQVDGLTRFERMSAFDIPEERFRALEAGDILLVDTTHTVKIGGEVTRIVLDILPLLAPGVLVQFHDIYLPYEYPRRFIQHERMAFVEQYLLQAFLQFNSRFEIVVGAYALAREQGERLSRVVPSFAPGNAPPSEWLRPGAIWLRVNGSGQLPSS